MATDAARPMFATKVTAVVLFVAAIVLLGYDLFFNDAGRSFEFESNAPSLDYSADISFTDLKYDPVRRTISATLQLEVLASTPDLQIPEVAFSLVVDREGGVIWRYMDSCAVDRGEDVAEPGGPPLDRVMLTCGPVTLPLVGMRHQEFWYPFDNYAAALFLRACVNRSDACLERDNLVVRRLRIDVVDPDVVAALDGDLPALTLRVQRKFFIRMVSVIFLVMSLIFLGYFARSAGSHDVFTKSLGFFATLWGLRAAIIPDSVKEFPTLVDYAVLTIFVSLFAAVLYKLPPSQKEAAHDEDREDRGHAGGGDDRRAERAVLDTAGGAGQEGRAGGAHDEGTARTGGVGEEGHAGGAHDEATGRSGPRRGEDRPADAPGNGGAAPREDRVGDRRDEGSAGQDR